MNFIKYLIVFTLFAFASNASLFHADESRLSNGLRVIVAENHKAPIAKIMLFYKVGAMDESLGKSGLAHLLEHLMFRGTKNVSSQEFNDIMLSNGVEYNAFTTMDFTAYHALVDISRLELVMALEADRMTDLVINDAAFEGEQKIVCEERQQRVKNNPKAMIAEERDSVLWQKTPYGHPLSGTIEEITSLSKEDASDFYKRFYAPDNAVLVIVGDITPQTGFALAEKYFGHIRKKSVKPLENMHAFDAIKDGGTYYIKKEHEDIKTTQISLYCAVPSLAQDTKNSYALSVFSNYLGESQNSYLKREMVDKQKLIAASSSLRAYSRGNGVFTISAVPFEKDKPVENFTVLKDTMHKAVQTLTPEDVEKEKKKILSWFVYVQDDPEDLAYFLGVTASLGLSLAQIEDYNKDIEALTFEEVKEAATRIDKDTRCITSVVTQKKEAEND